MTFQDDASRVPGPGRLVAEGCPLRCGGKIVYRGFTSVECNGPPMCGNATKDPALSAPEAPTGSWEWACLKSLAGEPVEYYEMGVWWFCSEPAKSREETRRFKWRLESDGNYPTMSALPKAPPAPPTGARALLGYFLQALQTPDRAMLNGIPNKGVLACGAPVTRLTGRGGPLGTLVSINTASGIVTINGSWARCQAGDPIYVG